MHDNTFDDSSQRTTDRGVDGLRPNDLFDPDDPPRYGEGVSVALVMLIIIFLLGFVLGAILW
jgi:hypothetical protein